MFDEWRYRISVLTSYWNEENKDEKNPDYSHITGFDNMKMAEATIKELQYALTNTYYSSSRRKVVVSLINTINVIEMDERDFIDPKIREWTYVPEPGREGQNHRFILMDDEIIS